MPGTSARRRSAARPSRCPAPRPAAAARELPRERLAPRAQEGRGEPEPSAPRCGTAQAEAAEQRDEPRTRVVQRALFRRPERRDAEIVEPASHAFVELEQAIRARAEQELSPALRELQRRRATRPIAPPPPPDPP